jgi:hypothetical protein
VSVDSRHLAIVRRSDVYAKAERVEVKRIALSPNITKLGLGSV